MLFAIEPLSVVFATVNPAVHPVAMFAVIVKVALIRLAIVVNIASLAMQSVFFPLAVIHTTITPCHLAIAVYHTITPLTFVFTVICEFAGALAVSATFVILALVGLPVG